MTILSYTFDPTWTFVIGALIGAGVSGAAWYFLAGRHFDRVIRELLKEQKELQASNRRYNGEINRKRIECNSLKAKLANAILRDPDTGRMLPKFKAAA